MPLSAILDKTSEASNANINKLKYMMADFDNYRKQMEKHLGSKIETSKADLLLKFLNMQKMIFYEPLKWLNKAVPNPLLLKA